VFAFPVLYPINIFPAPLAVAEDLELVFSITATYGMMTFWKWDTSFRGYNVVSNKIVILPSVNDPTLFCILF
jgi:hypothetical protein